MNDRFLKACRREPVDCTPVWRTRAVILVVLIGLLACSQNPESSSPPKPEVAAPLSTQPATESVASPKTEPVSPPEPIPQQKTAAPPTSRHESVKAQPAEVAHVQPFVLAGRSGTWVGSSPPGELVRPEYEYSNGKWSVVPWPYHLELDDPEIVKLPSVNQIPSSWTGLSEDMTTWYGVDKTGQRRKFHAKNLRVFHNEDFYTDEPFADVFLELDSEPSGAVTNSLEAVVVPDVEVTMQSPDWNELHDLTSVTFQAKEKEFFKKLSESADPPERSLLSIWRFLKENPRFWDEKVRKQVPIELKLSRLRHATSGEEFIRFFARKKYYAEPPTNCPRRVDLGGWIRKSSKESPAVIEVEEISEDDCEGVRTVRTGVSLGVSLPHGMIVFMSTSNYDGEGGDRIRQFATSD